MLTDGAVLSRQIGAAAYMNDEQILKKNLKIFRTEKRLSQSQLAEMIGVSRNTISSEK